MVRGPLNAALFMCGGRDGACPHEVDISTINRALMYAEGSSMQKAPNLSGAFW